MPSLAKPSQLARAIREVRSADGVSRADVAEAMGITRSTAGRYIDQLLETGYLSEAGAEKKEGSGRPGIILKPNPDRGVFIGIDLEGSSIYGVRTDFAQKVERREIRRARKSQAAEQVLEKMVALIQRLAEDREVLAVGVAVQGRVDPEKGLGVESSHIEGWKDVPVVAYLEKELGLPVFIENNARCAAMGEFWFGKSKGVSDLACLLVRSGVAAGVLIDGKPLSGSGLAAGEISGWKVGQEKTLGELASADAMGIPISEFEKALSTGDRSIIAKLESVAAYHGEAVARLIQLLDPGAVVLAGAYGHFGDRYLEAVRTSAADSLQDNDCFGGEITLSNLGDHGGAVGSAALALNAWTPAPLHPSRATA